MLSQAQDFEDPDVHHRHLSHLFGLFPGHTITVEKAPDLCEAAEISLYKRGFNFLFLKIKKIKIILFIYSGNLLDCLFCLAMSV